MTQEDIGNKVKAAVEEQKKKYTQQQISHAMKILSDYIGVVGADEIEKYLSCALETVREIIRIRESLITAGVLSISPEIEITHKPNHN